VRTLFVGDSLTEQWETVPDLWAERFGACAAANFGVAGDGVQHVLWRIEHHELERLNPRGVVLLVGTNNTRNTSGLEIAHAISHLVDLIRLRLSDARILLLGIFPRGPGTHADGTADDGVARMHAIREANAQLARFANGQAVQFLDLGDRFVDASGRIASDLMPDNLHLSPAGYRVWADAMCPWLDELFPAAKD
jgi:beta-glucosidase